MAHSTNDERISLRVLIVDPHEISRAAVRALLQTEGADVVADVATGDEALALESIASPDVAIIDVSQSVSDALIIADALAKSASMPAVVLTSSTTPKESLDGHTFIAKPDLCAQVLRVLPKPNEP